VCLFRCLSQSTNTVTQAYEIIDDFFDDDSDNTLQAPPLFTCDSNQATYIRKKNTIRTPVFNKIMMHSKTSTYKTVLPRKNKQSEFREDGPRMQLAENEANATAMKKYQSQMEILLRSIFRDENVQKLNPLNWKMHMTNIVGGDEYQHAHSDQGRPLEFRGQKTYLSSHSTDLESSPFSFGSCQIAVMI
jgi:hypothetical protein